MYDFKEGYMIIVLIGIGGCVEVDVKVSVGCEDADNTDVHVLVLFNHHAQSRNEENDENDCCFVYHK